MTSPEKILTPDIIKSGIGAMATVAIAYIIFRKPKSH